MTGLGDIIKKVFSKPPVSVKETHPKEEAQKLQQSVDAGEMPVFQKEKITVIFVLGGPGVGESAQPRSLLFSYCGGSR